MWSLTVLHRHALYGDYRVTEGCWVECESQVPTGGVDRLCVGVWLLNEFGKQECTNNTYKTNLEGLFNHPNGHSN